MSDFEILKYHQQRRTQKRQLERRNQNKISTCEDRNTETHAGNRKKDGFRRRGMAVKLTKQQTPIKRKGE